MIDVSPQNLYQEAHAAERWAMENLAEWTNQIARYHTSAYRKGSVDKDYPENYYFSYVTHQVAKLATGDPRARVSTAKEGPEEATAIALQYGWNRWQRDVNYKRDREKFATDSCFGWPVAMVTLRPRAGLEQAEDPLTIPAITRISPRRFFWDPYALTMEEARFMGHIVVRDKEDIRREAKAHPDAGWNLDVLDNMAEDVGARELRGIKSTAENMPSRKEVLYYEVAVFDAELPKGFDRDDGYNWMIYTLPRTLTKSKSTSEYLRKPRPGWGDRGGPYVVGGAYTVPDMAAPLAPLVAAEGQISELNAHVRAANRAAARRKSVALVDGLKPAETAKIVNAEDGDVIAVKGLDKSKVVEIETGGVTAEAAAWNLELRGRVDRNLAMSDEERGQSNPGSTATAVSVAANNNAIRSSFVEDKFSDFERRAARKVMWLMNESESTVFHTDDNQLFVGGRNVKESMRRVVKHGLIEEDVAKLIVAAHAQDQKSEKEGSGTSFDDLEVDILSVRDDGQEQIQMAALGQQLIPVLQLVGPTASWFPWDEWFRKLGEAYKMPELTKVDVGMAASQFAAQLQATQAGAAGQSSPTNPTGTNGQSRPRLAQDVGGSNLQARSAPQARSGATPGATAKPKVRNKPAQPIGAGR